MTLPQSPRQVIELSLFKTLPVYVLAYGDDDGTLQFMTERTEQGVALVCFLSRFDAIVEGAQFAITGQSEHSYVFPASDINPALFRDASGRGVHAIFHMGWPALDGRVLQAQANKFHRFARTVHYPMGNLSSFEVDALTLALFGGIRELAGLYAWQETHEHVLNWDKTRLWETAKRAIQSIELSDRPSRTAQQMALFDPEAGQWHFLPFAATDFPIIED